MIQTIVIFALIVTTVAVIAFMVAPKFVKKRVIFAAEPDSPKSFGCGMAWLAIKADDPNAVAEALDLTDLVPANWNSGIGTIYDAKLGDTYAFVSPPVKGWIFVAGIPLPLPVGRSFVDKLTPLLARLSGAFRDVQYFAAYPDIDLFAWARLERGRMVRAFAIGDEQALAVAADAHRGWVPARRHEAFDRRTAALADIHNRYVVVVSVGDVKRAFIGRECDGVGRAADGRFGMQRGRDGFDFFQLRGINH